MATLATTNSFVTLAEADAYFDTQYNRQAAWAIISDENKSRLLIEATSMMVYQLTWILSIDNDNPGDIDSEYVSIRNACCEQAWYIYTADRQSLPGTKGISMLKADVLEMEIDKTDVAGRFAPSLSALLTGYAYVPGALNVPVMRG